ncbi:LRR receptor-like serine/threonine-protein kinase GSO2 [Pyrus ussuriensis x Pyrus communis]|uniref:LRR receptor-like serine/threonine-protein kinase GSO2 n=1 Tax=Pyrus ussuriensis x Pyrus communis TaxID=2448454 RepID=A0A5N5H4B2_9ROSA|nr:LRR receptor-like serine/threonine-protein kinase GSO2 [Pyrus ussuriensis x Pyrus communis]
MGGIMLLLLLITTLHVNLGQGDANMTMRCTDKEMEALLAFKQGLIMDEDSQVVFSPWGTEAAKQDFPTCCRWKGVSCDNQTGHVVRLHLGGYYFFQGTMISPKLIELKHLKYLDFWRTYFSGSQVPYFIGSLTNLRYLDLSWCSFGGKFPIQVGNLTNLQYLDLGGNDFGNVENLNWLPRLSLLTYLELSYANLSNAFDWPEAVNKLPKLTYLTLRNCSLPSPPVRSTLSNINSSKSLSSIFLWLSTNNTSLVDLSLSSNHLTGSIRDVSLAHVDLSENQLEGAEPHSFSRLCSLQSLNLERNNLSGQFSKFVQILSTCAQNSLERLWLSENQLAGPLPDLTNFLSLKELDISYNQLSGRIPESMWQMSKLEVIGLGVNALEGVISDSRFSKLSKLWSNSLVLNFHSNWIPHFQLKFISLSSDICANRISWYQLAFRLRSGILLDLFNNNISGWISFLCASAAMCLRFLNLSYNNLSGELPECLTHLGNLVMLDLSSNALSGKIPTTIGSLFGIATLKLRSNEFVGYLMVLDLADNQLLRSIPEWLGASFQKLVILKLSSNYFNGSLKLALATMRSNTHSNFGCLTEQHFWRYTELPKKLTTLAQKGNSILTIEHSCTIDRYSRLWNIYEDDEIFIWKGSIHVYRNTLGLVRSIDFSSNRLTGEILSEISHLVGLVSLNLSRNQLSGQITPDIGKLESLDSLDLSRNHIDGGIPTSLARISHLGVLDLSHNNLIGKIPTGTQLQNFDHSVYAGNPHLCGPPLQNPCDIEDMGPDQVSNEEDKDDQLIRYGFYISMGLGFFVGFWGVCGSLIFIKEWRYVKVL